MARKKYFWIVLIPVLIVISGIFYFYFGNLYYTNKARRILNETGIEGGLIVHVDPVNSKITGAFNSSDRYVVHGITSSERLIQKARDLIKRKGLYGKVSLDHWEGGKLPYSDNMVNILVIEDKERVSDNEIMRVLAPEGVAMIRVGGEWDLQRKPWPSNIDEWTHYLHGPDGNQLAKDSVVGPPRHIKWMAKPKWGREHRYGNKTAMVSAKGRLFYVNNEVHPSTKVLPDRPFLVARDAFNGVLLWKKPIYPRLPNDLIQPGRDSSLYEHFEPMFPMEFKMVANEDRLYLAFGEKGEIQVLDAVTGKLETTYQETEHTEEILYSNGMLITVVPEKKSELKEMNFSTKELNSMGFSRRRAGILRAIDSGSGLILWEYDTKSDGGLKVSPVIKEDHIFTIIGDQLVAINKLTGECVWQNSLPDDLKKKELQSVKYASGPPVYDRLIAGDNVILLVYNWRSTETFLNAFSGKTGEQLWSHEFVSPERAGAEAFVVDDKVWVHAKGSEYKPLTALDIQTGKELIRHDQEKIFNVGHHHRCYGNRATSCFLLTAMRGTEFTNFNSGDINLHHHIRGKCRFGVLPCNGLLYSLPHGCSCYPNSMLRGYSALAPEGEFDVSDLDIDNDDRRLVRGSYYNKTEFTNRSDVPDSWPTYRRDAKRSGSTSYPVDPEGLTRIAWSTSLDEKLSGLTAANDRLFVCTPETHTVHALDINSGNVMWSYTAGGRIDSPPTFYNNMLFFGSKDGYVYCLNAETGGLVWRFRAAPVDLRMIDEGQLESKWPVHGGVLIKDGRLYISAGRSSLLDGGIFLYMLEPESGKVLAKNRLYEPYSESELKMIGNMGLDYDAGINYSDSIGIWNDILSSEDTCISLGQLRLNNNLNKVGISDGQFISMNGMLNPNWYSRIGSFFGKPSFATYGSNLDVNKFELLSSPRQGSYMIFDEELTYSLRIHPALAKFHNSFIPGEKGYGIFVDDNRTLQNRWHKYIPIRVEAMVATAGETLFLAGSPDIIDKDDPWGAIEGRIGGMLWALSIDDGQKLVEYQLDSPPVFDGMIAVKGNLYMATMDGKVICIGE